MAIHPTSTIFLFTALCVAVSALVSVEVHRRPTLKGQMRREGKLKEYYAMVERQQLRRGRFGKGGGIPEHINVYRDFYYVANITVGTPPQQFQVDLDTGSSDLWIPDLSCKDTDNCKDHNLYDSSESSTFVDGNDTFSITYGTGAVSGNIAVDTVKLGDGKGISIPHSYFGQATDLSDQFKASDTHFDGIFGLGFPELSETTHSKTTVLQTAIDQKLLPKPVFSIYMKEDQSEDNAPAGQFTFGGVDTENCGPVIDYRPVTQGAGYWQFEVDSISYGNYTYHQKVQVMSDSGTTAIVGDDSIFGPILKAAGADESNDNAINCKAKLHPLVFTIAGKKYAIEPKRLILEPEENKCSLAIDSGGFGGPLILGDPWIMQFCQIHDIGKRRIGFAKAKP